MKTVLIPTEDHDSMSAVLETARLIASRFDSYMEGVAVRPSSEDFVTFEPVSSLNMSSVAESDAEIARQARNLFESFMQTHDVPLAQQEQAEYSYGWVRAAAEDDAFIGSYGRLFDLIVLGRPGRRSAKSENVTIGSGAFRKRSPGSGRAAIRSAGYRAQHSHRVERQYRASPHDSIRDATAAAGKAGDCPDGRRRNDPRAGRR